MGISRVLGLLAKQEGKVAAHDGQSAELTFSITNDYPDKIVEGNSQLFRLVGKRGQQSIYSLQAHGVGNAEMKAASAAKSKLIDLLVNANETLPFSKENIAKAQSIALGILNDNGVHEGNQLIAYMLAHDTVGYGPISMLLDDQRSIEEIVINSPDANIGVYHSIYGFCITNLKFNSERNFRYMINKAIASTERELNSNTPIIDAQIYDGSRLHAQLKPYSLNGAAASIRLNGGKSMDLRRIISLGTASPGLLAYIWLAIETNHNIIISGAPATGKTSFLLALNAFVPRHQRVITIEEDVNELKFYGNFANSVSLQGSTIPGKTNVMDQVVNALHLRPDRLIVGEVRGREANEMLAGSNFGVPFMTTMHSSGNGQAIINRLQSKPMSVEPQILSMLDVAIFMRQSGLTDRNVESVIEYKWLSRNEINIEDLPAENEFTMMEIGKDSGLLEDSITHSKVIAAYSKIHLLGSSRGRKELKNRAAFLNAMVADGGVSVPEYIGSYSAIK